MYIRIFLIIHTVYQTCCVYKYVKCARFSHPWIPFIQYLSHPPSPRADRTVKVWDLKQGCEMCHFTGHSSYVRNVTYCGHTRQVFSTSKTTIKVCTCVGLYIHCLGKVCCISGWRRHSCTCVRTWKIYNICLLFSLWRASVSNQFAWICNPVFGLSRSWHLFLCPFCCACTFL